MRSLCLFAVAACSSPASVGTDASVAVPDAPSPDATVLAPWGERCGDGTDDDGDGLVDEDCAPSLFAGAFVPRVSEDPVLDAIETASSRPLAVIQTYHSLSAQGIARTAPDLAAIFARGQVAHLNIEPSDYTAQQYASPASNPLAADLAAMGDAIASALAAHPRGRVLATFGAEMNGAWTDWGCLPAAQYIALYRAAHTSITAALTARGIDTRRVRWVYGPNNVSSGDCGSLAGYYPGHAYVDQLGMSAYRAGSDSVASTVIAPMNDLFDALGYAAAWRRDRFVLLQTGSRALPDRTAWIDALFSMLAADARVSGIIYFSAADWTVQPAELANALAAAPVAGHGLDGVFAPHFWDVPYDHPAFHEIQALRDAGITSGCASAPARFCPDDIVVATEAMALLQRAFPTTTVTLADPVTEADVAAAVAAAGGSPPSASNTMATRARAATIIAHGASLRPSR